MKDLFTSRLQDMTNFNLPLDRAYGLLNKEDSISFAERWFASECYSAEGVARAVSRALQVQEFPQQRNAIEGDLELRSTIMNRMFHRSLSSAEVEQTLITLGRQHTLELIAQAMLEQGDTICTNIPVHAEVWQLIHKYGAQIVMVSSDEHGILLEELEVKLKKHQPKFIYINSSNDRDTDRKWTKERMMSLLQLCRAYHTLIIEEDSYGELQYGSNLLRMVELEQEGDDRIVVYVSSFGKGVFPGIQLGIVVADARVIDKLTQQKQRSGTYNSLWEQMILKEMLHLGVDIIDQQLQRMVTLSQRCMQLIEEHLYQEKVWKEASGIRPQGGMYYKIALPNELPIQSVHTCALRKQVLFVPEIYINQLHSKLVYKQYIRLSCTISDSEQVHRGMKRLGETIGEFLGRYSI